MSELQYQRPRGFRDILPADSAIWKNLEDLVRGVVQQYGYREIRLPMMEKTGLFERSIGEETDIVEKEMFTVQSRENKESLSLRPEFTAPFVRAVVENHLLEKKPFWKLFYLGPAFRYEKPQKGRYRQFHQVGMEAVGAEDPLLDVELMEAFMDLLDRLQLSGLELQASSIGCLDCRSSFRNDLLRYLESVEPQLCEDCRRRKERNVFRVLDCKNEECRTALADAPVIYEHLCEECDDHWKKVVSGLENAAIPFTKNERLGRGFDYYTKTIFEVVDPELGAQNAVGGGGRYDRLFENIGKEAAPAAGCALGLERLLLSMKERKNEDVLRAESGPDLFLVWIDRTCQKQLFQIASDLRDQDFSVELNFEDRSLKGQMRAADHSGAPYVGILGPDELNAREITMKEMESGSEEQISWDKIGEKLS